MTRRLRRPPVRTLALLFAALPLLAGAAEFQDGVDAHARGDYAAARAVFADLAELGDGPSQYNLGAMALRGEGVAEDRGEAAGWMLAARENGHDPTPRALDALRGKLTDDERARADAIVARFGAAALARGVLPPPERLPKGELTPPRLVSAPKIEYPERWGTHAPALLVVRAVIGTDGRPRDPRVLVAIPPVTQGGRAYVRALVGGILGRRYEPAREDGRPIAVSYNFRASFRPYELASGAPRENNEDLLDRARVAEVALAAGAGDPRAQYLEAVLDLASGKACQAGAPCADVWATIRASARAGVPDAQLLVGRQLTWAEEYARALPWLARAATSGLPGAEAEYGLALLLAAEPRPDEARALLLRGAEGADSLTVRRALETLSCGRDARLRSPETAYALSERVDLDDEPDPMTAAAVAAARAAAGRFSAAVDAQKMAVKRARKLGWDVGPLEARLRDYRGERGCAREPEPADPKP